MSAMFVGSCVHALDSKNRIFVPAKFREQLGSVFYITRKFDSYLSVYTAEAWDVFVQKIASLPESEAQELQDYLLGSAQKCVPDNSGRIIIDEVLMRHAGIDNKENKNVVFVGSGEQIRIFSEKNWKAKEEARDLAQLREIMRANQL